MVLMSKLRAHYQNPVTDAELWKASVNVYFDELSRYSAGDVRIGFAAAWREHPQWMPSCGDLEKLIKYRGKKEPEPEYMRRLFYDPDDDGCGDDIDNNTL